MSTHWKRIVELVERQAEDIALWAPAMTATEAYLQRALRSLHAMIEEGSEVPEIERLARLAFRRKGSRMSLPGIDRLRAEIAMLEGERERRTARTPRLDSLIAAKQRSLTLLEKIAASITRSPRRTRRRS